MVIFDEAISVFYPSAKSLAAALCCSRAASMYHLAISFLSEVLLPLIILTYGYHLTLAYFH
jgi:hypothetical protein